MSGAHRGTVLVCGGAGYIGSHMCKHLARAGYLPVTFDNLSTGHRHAVRWGPLEEGDLLDPPRIARLFGAYRFDAVMHFAARSLVGESMAEPGLYFRNNVTGTLNLLDAMRAAGVSRLVFSSTAAVYGSPEYVPIDEAHPTRPINPYGWSKLFAERQIEEYCRAHGLAAVALRYFNAAGADSEGELGEEHEPETHLIPNLVRAALHPERGPFQLFGTDHATPDGTCIRDYVHVEDLCEAHLLALARLDSAGFRAYNLGTGTGHSVAEVLAACRERCGGAPEASEYPRRAGDPPVLVATCEAFHASTRWVARRSLGECLDAALHWAGSKRSGAPATATRAGSHGQ